MSGGRTYSASVRVGNWFEDVQLEEDALKDFLEKRELGELLIQKSGGLLGTANAEISLSISRDGKVHFGDTVLLVNPSPKNGSRAESCLAMSLPPSEEGFCEVGATSSMKPVARTAFVVVSCDGTSNGEILKYGQPFFLCSTNGQFFLSSDKATFDKSAKKSRNNPISFIQVPSRLTEWIIVPFNPLFRLELENHPVPANERLIFTHRQTNTNLNVEVAHKLRTAFGMEYEVSGHTALDSHKAETDTNHWQVMMKVPGDDNMDMTSSNK